ncbi:MAG: DUF3467 domain-containing protein [Terriglobales bacterium]|jgi:hypothetical protein
MPENPPPPSPPQPKVEAITPPEGIYSLYSNHVGLAANQSDIRILFGELTEATPEKVRVMQRVHVIVSWLQAKALASLLQDYLAAFEKNNGPIMPPALPAHVALSNPFKPK